MVLRNTDTLCLIRKVIIRLQFFDQNNFLSKIFDQAAASFFSICGEGCSDDKIGNS